MTKYRTAREAYIDYLTGKLTEIPIDSKGRLLEQFDGNDYTVNPNDWIDSEIAEEDEGYNDDDEDQDGELFDPSYHEDYFDIDEVDEYGDVDEDYDSYLDRDCWGDDPDEDDEETWGEV